MIMKTRFLQYLILSCFFIFINSRETLTQYLQPLLHQTTLPILSEVHTKNSGKDKVENKLMQLSRRWFGWSSANFEQAYKPNPSPEAIHYPRSVGNSLDLL